MANRKGRAGLHDGQVIATIKDKFGEDRKVVQRGSRIRIAQSQSTPILTMNRPVGIEVGKRIREARLDRGFTLEELAIRCGITSGWPKNRMWEIESGQRAHGLRFGTLYAIAAALNIEATALMPPVSTILAKAEVVKVQAKIVTLTGGGKVVDEVSLTA